MAALVVGAETESDAVQGWGNTSLSARVIHAEQTCIMAGAQIDPQGQSLTRIGEGADTSRFARVIHPRHS